MAKSTTKPAKSESLTIRLDPKMRFALEFIARVKGQSITTVVERAVKQVADNMKLSAEEEDTRNWLTYWSVSEGIRAIRLAEDQDTNPTFDEDELLDFVRSHRVFFASDPYLKGLRTENIDILWPHIEDLVAHWRETRSSDRLATGKRMQQFLRNAGGWVPAWPQEAASRKAPSPPPTAKGGDLDDEIPF